MPECLARRLLDKSKSWKNLALKFRPAAMVLVSFHWSPSDISEIIYIIDLAFSASDKNTPLIQQFSLLGNNFYLNL